MILKDHDSAPAVSVRGITKTYPGFAPDQATFTVPRGRIVGCIGGNGAGKTTLISLMLGLLRPETGSVRLEAEL